MVVGQRKLFAPTTHTTTPWADIGLSFARLQQVVDGLQHFFDHQSTVTNNWHIGATHLALLGGVDVDVDNFCIWRETRHLAGDSVVEARTKRNKQVGFLHRGYGSGGAVHAGHAQTQRVRVGEGPARHQCGDNRNLGEFGEFTQHTGSACFQHTATHIQHRLARGQNHARCFFDHLRMAFCIGAVARQAVAHFVVARPIPIHFVLQNIFGNIDERWARATSGGNVKRLAYHHRQILSAHHQLVVFGDAASDTHGVALLKCVGTDCSGGHLTSDADHRNGVHICIAQWRDQVGGCRAARHHGHTWSTSDVGITLGHVTSTLFMAHEDVANF